MTTQTISHPRARLGRWTPLPLILARHLGWPLWTWLSLAAAPMILAAFAIQQRWLITRDAPGLLPPGLLAAPGPPAGLMAHLVFWCGQASFFLVLSLYLQEGRGLSALQAGLVFTILAVAYLATSLQAPVMTVRHGRRVLATGALILAAGRRPPATGRWRSRSASAALWRRSCPDWWWSGPGWACASLRWRR